VTVEVAFAIGAAHGGGPFRSTREASLVPRSHPSREM